MPYLAAVRYGRMNATEKFISQTNDLRTGDEVIIRTERGIEFGYVSGAVTSHDQEAGKRFNDLLRKATEDDSKIQEHITSAKEPSEMAYCTEQIQVFELPMKLTAVEHLFGGDKIIFYFLADGRVDFRQLVKTLAKQYRTRIEMRQIGVRDEARLLADYEHCGRELCCRTFMQTLEPVTMRMAKLQKTTLDPNKISGHCGRLMCCLRFEDEIYAELKKNVPQKGVFVRTEEEEGEVIDYNLLKQTCFIETRGGERITINVADITERLGKRRDRNQQSGDKDENKSRGDKNDSKS